MNKNRSIRVAAFCLGLMLAGSLQVHAQKVTFRDGTVSLKQAFEKIEASSKYKIAYNDSHLNVSRKVSLNQKETEVLEILATILKDTGYTYKKNGNYIVIVPVEQKPASKVKKVKGVVKDASGEAIIGANVLVKGTATGVITDMNGSFELEVPGNAVLQITYIGYVQQDVAVKNRDQLAVLLKEDTKTLDEVVVVGYGTMKKKDLTGFWGLDVKGRKTSWRIIVAPLDDNDNIIIPGPDFRSECKSITIIRIEEVSNHYE